MNKRLEDILPVYAIEEDCIPSKNGDYTVCYQIEKPEIFTLSAEEYEAFHQTFVKALKILPVNSIFHMQDWFVENKYKSNFTNEERSMLAQSSERFFFERRYLSHTCHLFLTKSPSNRKVINSAASNLLRKSIVPDDSLNTSVIQDFLDCCGQFERILTDSGFITVTRLKRDEIWSDKSKAGIIEKYVCLRQEDSVVLGDISFKDGMKIGYQHCQLFTLSDAEDLPSLCGPRINFDKYSTDKTKFSVGFASVLGQLLSCNHVYNQYIFIKDAQDTLKKLESKRLRLQSLSNYSRENSITHDATNDFLNEAISEQRLPVKCHFNILTWSDNPKELKEIRNKVSSALAQMEATPKLETVGAPQIYWAGIPGNEADFPENECFDTFAEQACCFLNCETNYRTSVSPFGIRLGDRLTGRPVHVDMDDEPRAMGITNNSNTTIISGSGGGKSYFTNHLVRSYYEQGCHVLIVDVGGSYEIQCALHGGYYFTYEEKNPIRFNPFYIGQGDILDTEKKESIKTLLLALWKKSDESHNRSEYVALSNALQLYFEKLENDSSIFPCFDSFYEFLKNEFVEVLKTDNVKDKDFDMSNFLYVLRPYYKGGEFDYLLNAKENLNLLQQRFIVFELDNIKDHPILFPVVTLIIMELFVSKMRKLKGVRKMIVIEEAWKAIAKQGMAEYIKYLFKTVRKFFGKAVVVTQEIEDIISSEIIKQAIINNSDVKILLDQSKFQNKFNQIQELLGITDKQKAEILSINKAQEPGRRYKDLWICLGTSHSKVYRLETSKEEYYTYTSDQKEKLLVNQYIARYGNVKKAIQMLVSDLSKK